MVVISPDQVAARDTPIGGDEPGRWQYYGGNPAGTRHVGYTQITPENVDGLEVAWTFRTGELAGKGSEFQNTPIQIEDSLYLCTPLNQVFSLDADTGEENWRFDPKIEPNGFWNRCRGVGFHESRTLANDAICKQRIITTTNDARMIALDAATGRPCEDFGANGEANLTDNMGPIKTAYYMPTSMPTVTKGLVIVGGWVYDGQETNEPSGVVRAYDAENGELVWAWNLGNPGITRLPPEGKTYTRGTPNMWSTPVVDEELGLIYLPFGNSTPDFWGGHRSEASKEYGASVAALDIATGRERWHFQTTHYDVWDYDVPAQPALVDVKNDTGETVPALVQTTKTGFLYVLDRRDGTPVKTVKELPVSQDGEEGDALSPTQPFSVDMPHFGGDGLEEKDMWGATFFDQLACRIAFRKLRYEGLFTPPSSEQRSLIYPGYYGGMNWGSISIDEERNYAIIDIRPVGRGYTLSRTTSPTPKPAHRSKRPPGNGFVYQCLPERANLISAKDWRLAPARPGQRPWPLEASPAQRQLGEQDDTAAGPSCR